jgi:hypothetical protein
VNRDDYAFDRVIICLASMILWLSWGVSQGRFAPPDVWQHALAYLFGWFVLGNMVVIPILRRLLR